MNRQLYFVILTIALLISACAEKKTGTLKINNEPALKFLGVINYLKSKDTVSTIKDNDTIKIIENRNDAILKDKIEKLLQLPEYSIFVESSSAFNNAATFKGKNAYREAFYNLPYKKISMSGVLTDQWIEYWDNGYNISAEQMLNKLSNNIDNVESNIIHTVNNVLPETTDQNQNIEVVLCIDGSSSDITRENKIFIDLIDYNRFNNFENVIAFRVHQHLYNRWFKFNYAEDNTIYKWQKKIIVNGSSHLIDVNTKDRYVQEMYNNKELLNELYNEWVTNYRALLSSKNPDTTYIEIRERTYTDVSFNRLKRYYKGDVIDVEAIRNRPVADNYLGYYIYNTINNEMGETGLKNVLENPDELLTVYNSVHKENMALPKIPDDIIDVWKINLRKTH
jgi:hypothetical protein